MGSGVLLVHRQKFSQVTLIFPVFNQASNTRSKFALWLLSCSEMKAGAA
jgi:hypothetical protein